MMWRPSIYLANLCFVAIVPLICTYISSQSGHSNAYLSTISANYLLYPERLIFAVGVAVFTLIYGFITGPISQNIIKNKQQALFAKQAEIIILAVFFTIAAIPAHLILGLHATLAGILAGSCLLWMNTIIEHGQCSQWTRYCRTSIYILACAMAFGMIVTFPHRIIFELSAARGNIEKLLYLLGLDKRWFIFAHFEWAFFYCIIFFFMTCTPLSKRIK